MAVAVDAIQVGKLASRGKRQRLSVNKRSKTYILSFGSIASRSPLPTRLSSVTARKIPTDGTMINHSSVIVMCLMQQHAQVASAARRRIPAGSTLLGDNRAAMPNGAATKTGDKALGRIGEYNAQIRRTERLRGQRVFDRRCFSTSPRTSRRYWASRDPNHTMMMYTLRPIRATSVKIKNSAGKSITTSITRETSMSILPRRTGQGSSTIQSPDIYRRRPADRH